MWSNISTLKLPSKKILLILGACIVAVGSIFFAIRPQNAKKPEDAFKDTYLKAVGSSTTELDSDKDGLKDWEELLWQTDPKNADTDGDGTSDSAEIREGRDPLKKGPDDKMATSTLAAGLASASSTENLSMTEVFARQFFTAYLQLKSQGITIDKNAQEQIVNQVLTSGNFPTPQPQVYTTSQIQVSGQTDALSLHTYANRLGQAMIEQSPKKKYDNEYEVFNNAVTKNDPKELVKMDIIIQGYIGVLDDYLKVPVPSNATQQHLRLVNSISALVTDLKAMRAFFDDPVAGYARFIKFPNDAVELRNALNDIATLLKRNNVTFIQSDPGYLLLYGT